MNLVPERAVGVLKGSGPLTLGTLPLYASRMRASEAIPHLTDLQLAYWRAQKPSYADRVEKLSSLAEEYDEFFIYRFAGVNVELAEKRQGRGGVAIAEIFTSRAAKYLELFSTTLRTFGLRLHGQLGMSMQDYPSFDTRTTPIFAFQKLGGEASLLLPDIDALWHGFYADKFDDRLCYRDKATEAVFVGSTTDSVHSVESVSRLKSPRLRSAVFFRDAEPVDFWLTNIVQCEDAAAEEAIRTLGVGFGEGGFDLDFSHQFTRKFLISMDGNGATCSRVAIALKSNSVLLKYASPHELYYFPALRAGQHYLLINGDRDVIEVIDSESRQPGLYEPVAAAGTEFFYDIMSRGPALAYTASLLKGYFEVFRSEGAAAEAVGGGGGFVMLGTAHVAFSGDQAVSTEVIGERGSGRAIEGLALNLFYNLRPLDFEYKLLPQAGAASPWRRPGRFAGSRGRSAPTYGFSLRLAEDEAAKFDVDITCRFVDGHVVGPLANGDKAVSRTGAALETIEVSLAPRP